MPRFLRLFEIHRCSCGLLPPGEHRQGGLFVSNRNIAEYNRDRDHSANRGVER